MFGWFQRLSISTRLYLMIAFFALGFCGLWYWSHETVSRTKVNGPSYQRIVQGKDLIADILPPPEYIIEAYLTMLKLVDELDAGADQNRLRELVDHCRNLKADYVTRHEFWVRDLEEGLMKKTMIVD